MYVKSTSLQLRLCGIQVTWGILVSARNGIRSGKTCLPSSSALLILESFSSRMSHWVMTETLLYLRQVDAIKGQQRKIAVLKCKKHFLEPQNSCRLLKINIKQIGISGRTNEHKANTFTLIQAPRMQNLITKCSLAALHRYKSVNTLKRGQYVIII